VPSLVLLAVLSGLSPFSMAIMLPLLPGLVAQFDSDFATVQYVISAYLLGLAITQPLAGFLCDLVGRRRVALIGMALFVVTTIACTFVDSLPMLIALRFLQAVGVSTGTVVSRAVIRDTHDPAVGARAMSYLTIGLGLAPVVSPMLGGWLYVAGGVRFVFAATALVGAVVWLLLWRQLHETLPPDLPRPRWRAWLRSYAFLLRSQVFMGYTLVFGFIQGCFFAFLAVGAAVFESSFGMGPGAFGVVWGCMAVSYVLGALIGGPLSAGRHAPLLLPVGMVATLLCGVAIPLCTVVFGVTPFTVLPQMFVLMTLSGAVTPVVMAGAVYHHPQAAGTSAGLSSALGMVVGSSFTIWAGAVYDGAFDPIAGIIAVAALLTFSSWLMVRRAAAEDARAVARHGS
jgi:DHA1 family bicyclomycin/chloramphenicol resistance-like MFS transporter